MSNLYKLYAGHIDASRIKLCDMDASILADLLRNGSSSAIADKSLKYMKRKKGRNGCRLRKAK